MAGDFLVAAVWPQLLPVNTQRAPFDTARRFVRVSRERPDRFVEFEFAVGEPDVFVELVLPREAFAEFCSVNAVTMLPPRDAGTAGSDWDWRLSDATGTRLK